MGHIDEALRRSNVDAAQGTGAEAPAPAASPWRIEERRDAEAPVPAEVERPVRRGGFDPRAIERLVVSKTAGPLLVEQFRGLAATLLRIRGERPLKSVLVTSPAPGDGKSHVAVNLALTLSDSYRRRVLLIEADLRRPSLHLLFGVPNTKGLSQALKATTEEAVATVRISDTLTLLPAGRPEPNPLSGLSSGRMKQIVADAASQFDWVIVDSPPVGVLADAHLVSETVDAALLVVRAGATRFPDLEAAADTMGHDRILGLVLNAVEPLEIRGQGYYHHYYGSDAGRS
jgi:capsular exopolysaccharide synthesis family protein